MLPGKARVFFASLLFLLAFAQAEEEERRPFILLPDTLPIVRTTTWNVCEAFHAALKERLLQLDCRMIKEERLRAYQNALDLDARAPLPKSQYKELLKTFHVDVILESHLLNCEFREEGGERIGILEGNLRIIDRDGSRAILPFQCKTPIAPNAGSPAQELVRRTVESLIEKLDVRQSFF